ncbi:MAG: PHP domain-containing protein [Saccharofermentanales bacterium]
MRIIRCDLHIHSALSPCADNSMTPCNIVNMSVLKGLEAIAVTDHQSCTNVAAASAYAAKAGLIVIPGMELETAESIHLICLFPTIEGAKEFEKTVRRSMPAIRNSEQIFGEQLIFNDADIVTGKEEQMLLASSGLSFSEALLQVESYGGICYPAHVDRASYSVISVLGTIPPEYRGRYLEISLNCDIGTLTGTNPEAGKYEFIRASDAHFLEDIYEPGFMVEIAQPVVGETDISLIINALRG